MTIVRTVPAVVSDPMHGSGVAPVPVHGAVISTPSRVGVTGSVDSVVSVTSSGCVADARGATIAKEGPASSKPDGGGAVLAEIVTTPPVGVVTAAVTGWAGVGVVEPTVAPGEATT